jgi:hypothetical protein
LTVPDERREIELIETDEVEISTLSEAAVTHAT